LQKQDKLSKNRQQRETRSSIRDIRNCKREYGSVGDYWKTAGYWEIYKAWYHKYKAKTQQNRLGQSSIIWKLSLSMITMVFYAWLQTST